MCFCLYPAYLVIPIIPRNRASYVKKNERLYTIIRRVFVFPGNLLNRNRQVQLNAYTRTTLIPTLNVYGAFA